MQIRTLLVSALLLLITSCGGGGSASSAPGALTGNWQMTLLKTGNTKFAKTESGFLVQNNDVITGSLALTDTPCSGVGNVAGTVSGSNVAMVISPTGVTVNLTGTMPSSQTMSGDFTILPNGCSASQSAPLSGTWTANLVTPLKGTLQGTFTSKKFATNCTLSPTTNTCVWQSTGQVAQGQNTGASSTTLTGSLSLTDYCVAGVTISGVVSGTSVVMNLVNSGGAQIGQVSGTSALDGSSITGTYTIIPQGSSGTPPCAAGDSGTVSFTL